VNPGNQEWNIPESWRRISLKSLRGISKRIKEGIGGDKFTLILGAGQLEHILHAFGQKQAGSKGQP